MNPNEQGMDRFPSNDRMGEQFWRQLDERVLRLVSEREGGRGFTDRKVTDTPTDALQVVNRRYVTLNGTTAQRPTSSVVGQFYFDSTLGIPVWWDGTSFVDAQGNVV